MPANAHARKRNRMVSAGIRLNVCLIGMQVIKSRVGTVKAVSKLLPLKNVSVEPTNASINTQALETLQCGHAIDRRWNHYGEK